jgi:predicted metal-binding protein
VADLAASVVVTLRHRLTAAASDGNVDAEFRPWELESFVLARLAPTATPRVPYCLAANADGSA